MREDIWLPVSFLSAFMVLVLTSHSGKPHSDWVEDDRVNQYQGSVDNPYKPN
jgi:hypothetical protein